MSAAEMLTEKAKITLGITGDDAQLTQAVETTLEKVLNDIRQPFLPLGCTT